MCIKSEFPIEGNIELTINEDCSVTVRDYVLDEELGGPDFDIIQLPKSAARKIAEILTRELG